MYPKTTISYLEKHRTFFPHLGFITIVGILVLSCAGPSITPSRPSRLQDPKQAQLYDHAQTFSGTPYRLGGDDRSGMDCSGLVVRLYRDVYNLYLPHSTAELYQTGLAVSLRSLEVGDLIFFREERGAAPSHVGVYLGNAAFIHASSTNGVIVSKLTETYYQKRFAGARRIEK